MTTIEGLTMLGSEIAINNCNWVSLSGGGDPLWNYKEHMDWYKEFFSIIPPDEVKTELHTSLIDTARAFMAEDFIMENSHNWFDRVVYHCHSFEQLKSIKRNWVETVRVVFVVTEDFTEDLINKIAVYCYHSDEIDELSFRQMVDNHYETTNYCKDYLKAGHQKLWWYIEQNDYNLYYVENKIYTEYRTIGR
jgi:hypothetical protein